VTVAAAPRQTGGADRATLGAGSAMVRETIAVAATLCGTVPALAPLAERGMASTHDGFLHVQRLIALEEVIRQGTPFTRWLPDLGYGYGQPLLLYYAPLAYLPALAARFLGAGYVMSFEISSGLALVLSALAMYVLARSVFGPVAATVAAIAYAVLPYQLVDIYVRGVLAESWAFVWLPLCAWCLIRAWADGRPGWIVGLALAVAGLVLTHNVTALLFLPALAALGVLLHLTSRGERCRAQFRWIAAMALGLALSAWFWLPALVDRDLVQIGATLEPELFASFFVRGWPPFRLEPLFDYERPVSTALGSPIFWPQVGLVQVVVTIAGAAAAVRTSGLRRAVAIWAILLAFGGYLMQLRPLAGLYDLVPLLAFVQFPWRLLALVGLGSAILAGVMVEALSARAAIRGVFAAAIVGASLVTAVARLDPEMVPVNERILSIESIARIELAEYGLGTTHSGEYLPVSSGQRNASRFRKTLIEAGSGDAGQESTQASDLQIERLDWRPDRVWIEVSAATPERLILHQFAFPGWRAWVDGVPVSIEQAGELGLQAVDVPAGRHTVEVAWTWTPIRTVAAVISSLALALLVPLAAIGRWRPNARVGLFAIVMAGVAATLLVPSWSSPANARSRDRDGRAQEVSEALSLAEVSHDTSRLSSEGVFVSRLVWLVRQPPPDGYRAHLEVMSANGQSHRAPWVYEPLSALWERGELVPTTIAVRLPTGFPAGDAQLRLVFERPDALTPASLGSIVVPPARSESSRPVSSEAVTVGSDMRLSAPADATDRQIRARPGESLDLPIRWEQIGVTPNVDRELLVVAVLAVPGGDVVSEPRRPGDWFSPLPFWQQGDIVEQNLRLALPPWMRRGPYPLAVRVYPRDLARSGASEPGASAARPRGRPVAELSLGTVTVEP
jgi:6-pyruvoyl-tetrahydropterin synthase related domain